MTSKTSREVVAALIPDNPGRRFAVSQSDSVIGVWVEDAGRFVIIASKTILNDDWYECPDMLVNGKPAVSDWIEIQ